MANGDIFGQLDSFLNQDTSGSDTLSALRSDPLFQEILDAQSVIRTWEYASPAAREFGADQKAHNAIRQNSIALARKYDVDVNTVFRVARNGSGENAPRSIAQDEHSGTFMERMMGAYERMQTVARSVEDAIPDPLRAVGERVGEITQPVRNFSANALGAMPGVLDPLLYGAEAFRTARMNFLVDQQDIVDEHPDWLPVFAKQAIDAVEAVGGTAGQLGLVGDEALSKDSGWITFLPTLRWGEKQLGRSPYEDERIARGTDLLELEGYDQTLVPLVERLGVSNEAAREIVGAGLEIAYDPLLMADFVFLGAGAMRQAGRVAKSKRLLEGATQAENAGRMIVGAQAPINVIRPAATQIGKSVRNLFEESADFLPFVSGIPGISTESIEAFGLTGTGRRVNTLTLGDLVTQGGVTPFDEDLHWLTGGSRWGAYSAETGTVGLMGEARAVQTRIQRATLRGISETIRPFAEQFAERVPRAFKKNRIVMPESIRYPENAQAALPVFNENVWQFLDTVGVRYSAEDLAPYLTRVQKLAKQNGLDPTRMGIAFRNSVASARKTILEVGHLSSRYDEFVGFIERAANDIGMNPGTARQLYERAYAGTDVTGVLVREGGDIAETLLRGGNATPVGELSDVQRQLVTQLDDKVRDMMSEAGFNPALNPVSYLRGVREGYARRVIGSRAAPEETLASFQRGHLAVMRPAQVDTELPARVADMFGEPAADAVRAYLETRPPGVGVFRTEELAGVIGKATGQEVNPRDLISPIFYPNDKDVQYFTETLEMIRPPASGGAAGEFAGTRGMDARKTLSDDALTQLNQMRDVSTSLAEMGRVQGQNAKASFLLDRTYQTLSENNWIMSGQELKKNLIQDTISGISYDAAMRSPDLVPFRAPNGSEWVVIPKNQTAWGTLAGHAVPADVAKRVTRALQLPSGTRTNAFLNLWSAFKGTLLSPFSTAMNNIASGFYIMSEAGMDLGSLIRNAPRGFAAREEFLQTGRIADLPGIEKYMDFMDDGTLTSTARKTMSEFLEDFGKQADNPDGIVGVITGAMDRTAEVMDAFADMPPIGWLGLFRAGEEATRLSAVYSMVQRLQRNGMPYEEALKRAAHFGNNAAHNYGQAPLAPHWLSKSGLSAFPQFAWFQTSRAARTLAERPSIPVRVDRYRNLANTILTPDPDEREAINAVMEPYMKLERPLVFTMPFGPQKGQKFAIPLSRLLGSPQAQFDSLVVGPLSGGGLRPILESLVADSLNGNALFSGQYGREVFDPASSDAGRAAQKLGFVVSSYLPPQFRLAADLWETVTYEGNEEMREALFGRHQNNDVGQLLMRMLGFTTRKIDTDVFGPSHQAKLAQIDYEYRQRRNAISRKIDQALVENDMERVEKLTREQRMLDLEQMETEMRLLDALN